MLPRSYEIEREYGKHPDPETGLRDSDARGFTDYRDASWSGVAAVGSLLVIIGIFTLESSGALGGGVILIGLIIVIGAGAGRKWESEEEDLFQEPEYYWEPDTYTKDDINRFREQDRKREIEEIVKAVKATIKVRCRYCGMLNEEKSNKCESCGGAL